MAKQTLLLVHGAFNGAAVNQWLSKLEVSVEVESKDGTTFASGGWNEQLAGLKSFEVGLGLKQDVAASAIDEIMWPLLGLLVPFEGRLNNGPVSASNPRYSGTVLINKWTPISGSVGDVAEADYTFPGSGALARAVA